LSDPSPCCVQFRIPSVSPETRQKTSKLLIFYKSYDKIFPQILEKLSLG
jgi:hypothetical protein